MIIELEKKHKVFIEVDMDEIIHEMNELPNKKRWALIAQIFRECNFDDMETISEGQKIAILHFLETNFKLYKFGKK